MPLVAHRMIEEIIEGDRHRRVAAVATLGMWFAAAAFVCSTAATYADTLLSVDVPEKTAAVVGGSIAAVVAAFFKAV